MQFASLLDVVFLLLLFLLIGSGAVIPSGIAVTPPQSRSALQAAADADIVTLASGADAPMFYNDRLVDFEAFRELLKDGAEGGGRRQLVIRADQSAPYGRVIEICNLAALHGYSVILATRPEPAR